MHRLVARRPSPAMVVALIALFVALGSGTYAAMNVQRNTVGTPQLKNGAVTEAKLHDNAVTSAKVKAHSLLASSFKAGQLPAGAQGPTGNVGAQGLKGDGGSQGSQGPPGPATGSAGGDLTGSYPNPTIAPGAVTIAKLGTVPAVSVFCGGMMAACNAVSNIGSPSIHFPVDVINNDGMHSTTTNTDRLTAPIAGIYRAEGFVAFPANSTGYRQVGIGTLTGCCFATGQVGAVSGTDRTIVSTAGLAQLNAGDSLILSASQNSGAPLTPGEARFFMSWVGP